jgi:hypothetical protein
MRTPKNYQCILANGKLPIYHSVSRPSHCRVIVVLYSSDDLALTEALKSMDKVFCRVLSHSEVTTKERKSTVTYDCANLNCCGVLHQMCKRRNFLHSRCCYMLVLQCIHKC